MQFAAITKDGTYTGAVYSAVTPHIRAHHAQYDEVLVAVTSLTLGEDDLWEAVEATPAEIAANTPVSRFQALAALHAAGLLEAAEAAVAEADPIVRIAWANAAEWRRDSPAIAAIGEALGLTSEQIDELFLQASQIAA